MTTRVVLGRYGSPAAAKIALAHARQVDLGRTAFYHLRYEANQFLVVRYDQEVVDEPAP